MSQNDELYEAYAAGREDEREDMRRELIQRIDAIPNFADRAPYVDMLLRISKPFRDET